MQLGASSSVDITTLKGLSRFLTNTLDNVSAFSDAHITALLNLEQRLLQTEILKALNFDWKENTVDGAGSGLINLAASDASYAFPTDMLQIDRIEISYTGEANTYRKATIVPMQHFDLGISNTTNNASVQGTESNPLVYIRNKVLYLDPIPKVAVTGGLRVWGQTLITDLSDSAHEPVWEDAFHELIAYGASQRWCAAKDKNEKANRLATERASKFANMVEFYSTRNATDQPRLVASYRSMK